MAVKFNNLEITVDTPKEFQEVISFFNKKTKASSEVKERVKNLGPIRVREDFNGRVR